MMPTEVRDKKIISALMVSPNSRKDNHYELTLSILEGQNASENSLL